MAKQLTLTVYIKEPALDQEKMSDKIIPSKPPVHIGKCNNREKQKMYFHTNEFNPANKINSLDTRKDNATISCNIIFKFSRIKS